MTTCSTHALDAALGRPAAGIDVVLTGAGVHETTTTDTDGRVRFAADLAPGPCAVTFATGPWFAAAERTTLFPEVAVAFEVAPGERHYHVALLLSPFSYTTYRGS